MPELKNPRWEKFAQAYVLLGNASAAYRQAGYRKADADVSGHRLLVNAGIKARISDLRAAECFKASMKREELEGYFVSVIKTPVGDITANHPLAQAIEVTDKGTKIRTPDKNVAAQALAKLNGWDAATKIEIASENPLTAYLRALRSKAIEGNTHNVQAIDDEGITP